MCTQARESRWSIVFLIAYLRTRECYNLNRIIYRNNYRDQSLNNRYCRHIGLELFLFVADVFARARSYVCHLHACNYRASHLLLCAARNGMISVLHIYYYEIYGTISVRRNDLQFVMTILWRHVVITARANYAHLTVFTVWRSRKDVTDELPAERLARRFQKPHCPPT